jgi:hypothetical protein
LKDKYIFLESAKATFYKKLEVFFECSVDILLLSGIAKNNSKIEDIDFKSEVYFGDYYLSILEHGTKAIAPFAQVQLLIDNRLSMELIYYDFSTVSEVSYIYMIENIMDFTSQDDFCCNLWSVSEFNKKAIKLFWSL